MLLEFAQIEQQKVACVIFMQDGTQSDNLLAMRNRFLNTVEPQLTEIKGGETFQILNFSVNPLISKTIPQY